MGRPVWPDTMQVEITKREIDELLRLAFVTGSTDALTPPTLLTTAIESLVVSSGMVAIDDFRQWYTDRIDERKAREKVFEAAGWKKVALP